MRYSGFDWDIGNKKKCKKHGLSLEEIESLFSKEKFYISPDTNHSQSEDRFIAIGITNKKRYAFVIFTFRIKNEKKLIRPISARYMHKKEQEKYESK